MDLKTFSLQLKLRHDRMVLLWPSTQIDYSAGQAYAITANMLKATDALVDQLMAYKNSPASWFQREQVAVIADNLRERRYAVASLAGQVGSAGTVRLPGLRDAVLSLSREMFVAADGLVWLGSTSEDFWRGLCLAMGGSWGCAFVDTVLVALNAVLKALGWIGGFINDLIPDLPAIPDWALFGAAGLGVYWFFLRK